MGFNTNIELDLNELSTKLQNKGIPWRPFFKKFTSLTLYSSIFGKQEFELVREGTKGRCLPIYFKTSLKQIIVKYPVHLNESARYFYIEVRYPYNQEDWIISCGVPYQKYL